MPSGVADPDIAPELLDGGHLAAHPGRRPHVQYLSTLRRRARLTQAQLAALSGVSQGQICRLELAGGSCKPDTRLRLAAALGSDPDRLAFGPNPHVLGARRRVGRRRWLRGSGRAR